MSEGALFDCSSCNVEGAIQAQAQLHQAYLLGLQLRVSHQVSDDDVERWMFRLFRKQHEEKFLESFEKLGFTGLPDAVACAKYHVLSNSIGGVNVEYLPESDQKAWVRFRYPRWMYFGPALCGVPVGVSRGFLKGWYAHNGVSLGNPRLGYVCVSEDMTEEFGLCGYFKEYDHELSEDERLQFAKGEIPPAYCASQQPEPPSSHWNTERLRKANRNYAVDFVRNALVALRTTLPEEQALALARSAARLTGLQYFQETRSLTGCDDGDLVSAVHYLQVMSAGLGDESELLDSPSGEQRLRIRSPRIVRACEPLERIFILNAWQCLWQGALASFRDMKTLSVEEQGDDLILTLTELQR